MKMNNALTKLIRDLPKASENQEILTVPLKDLDECIGKWVSKRLRKIITDMRGNDD